MATYHSGNGGHVNGGTGNTNMAVLTWSMTRTARLADTTASDSSALERRQKTVTGGTFQCKCLWDSTAIPDTDLSLQAGDEHTLKFYAGDSGKFYSFAGIIENHTTDVDNQTGVVTFNLTGYANGTITEPLT